MSERLIPPAALDDDHLSLVVFAISQSVSARAKPYLDEAARRLQAPDPGDDYVEQVLRGIGRVKGYNG